MAKDRRRWPRRVLMGVVGAAALFALVGFLVLPPIVRHLAQSQLGRLLGRRVTVGQVRINPFSLSLTVEDFQLFEPDGRTSFVGFGRLYVNAQLQSVYRRAPVLREVRLESPRVHLVRLRATPDGWGDVTAYNFSDILARLSAGATPETPPAAADADPPARFSVNNIRITDGQFTFDDRPLGSKHQITGFDLGVPFVSTLPTFIDTFVMPGLRLNIDGTPFALAARSKPFKDSLETTLELRATALDLTRYLPYVPVPLRMEVLSALLDVNVDVSFVRPAAEAARLTAHGRLAINKVALREKGGAPLLDLRQLEVLVNRADLMAREFKIDRVALAGLDVHARRLPDGSLNLERLAPPPPGPGPRGPTGTGADEPPPTIKTPRGRAAAPAPAPRFTIGEVAVTDVAVHLRDEMVHPPFHMDIDQITLSARGVSNLAGTRASLTFGMHAAPGGTLKDHGSFTLTPLAAQGTVTIVGIEPGRFAPYFREQIAFDVRDARVGVGVTYALSGLDAPAAPAGSPVALTAPATKPAPHVEITDAFLEAANVALRRRGAKDDFFRVANFAVRGVKLDPDARTVAVREVTTRAGRVQAERDERGVIDLSTLVAPAPTPSVPAAPAVPGGAVVAAPPKREPTSPGGDTASPWAVSLARLDVDGWNARFDDRMTKPNATVSLGPISIKASDLSTAPGARGTVDLKLGINKRGRLAVTGSAGLQPLSADLRIDLRTLEILPLQPYFADQVNLVVTDGTVSVKGRAKVDVSKGRPAAGSGARAAAPEPRISFAGDVDLTNFASVDGSKHEEFLKWKSFHVGQLALATAPLAVSIHDVALTEFYSRLVIFPDAHFNVQDIVRTPVAQQQQQQQQRPAPRAATPPPSPSPAISIGQITLQGGQVSFSDRLIRPNYSAELTDLAGRISGLSADGATQADVDIRGSVDHSGNLSITGKANPLVKDLFIDVKVDLKDFELPPASPYAAKYAGYGISKGKLALALDYHVAGRKLEAKNRLVVEQFTFGDKVSSPDATSLPVRLAVAILKDRHGVIDIDLPIAGSLDNPDFKIGRAVLKVLGNLIVKAATAPFALIGSLFGGGDELSHVDFALGAATVDAGARSRIASLAKALRERPGLSFEIEGAADPVRDVEGLKQHLYDRAVKAQKMLELVQSGAAVSDPDNVSFDPAERPRLLEKAYRAATFPKPRNVLGGPKDLPPAEMEKLMMANTVVDEDALRGLAERRATAVRDALAKLAPEGASRLFLTAPRLRKPSEASGNRVEFKLKKD